MFKISRHISEETEKIGLHIRKLKKDEKEKLIIEIEKKYLFAKKSSPMWDRLREYEFINDENAWSYLKNYILDNECILFFNQDEEKEMYEISSGYDLHILLSETYGYEFYVTNKISSYLFCFNHHDILYASGDSKKWISNIK